MEDQSYFELTSEFIQHTSQNKQTYMKKIIDLKKQTYKPIINQSQPISKTGSLEKKLSPPIANNKIMKVITENRTITDVTHTNNLNYTNEYGHYINNTSMSFFKQLQNNIKLDEIKYNLSSDRGDEVYKNCLCIININ